MAIPMATDSQPLTVLCPACHQPYARVDTVPQSDQGPRIEFYQCLGADCAGTGGKLAVLFEVDGAHAAPEPGFVQREIARRGAFFPSDHTRGAGRDW